MFWYSGELSNSRVRNWLETQMCGETKLETVSNTITGCEEKVVPRSVSSVLRQYYQDYIFIFGDNGGNNEDDIFNIMEYGYRRHDICRFILDNLKTGRFNTGQNKYDQQAAFVARCKAFCNQYKVHIDLVVHPRKTNIEEMADEDIGGSVDIIDLADNVIECRKAAYKDIKEKTVIDAYAIDTNRADLFLNKIRILKNREYGRVGRENYYRYNQNTRRIEHCSDKHKEYRYMKVLNFEPTQEAINEDEYPF